MKEKRMDLECIKNVRGILLGIATLIVMIFHSQLIDFHQFSMINVINNILFFFQRTGNGGVDLFLLLSGIGLYYSFSKNKLTTFYKNRIIRVLPQVIIIGLVYNIIVDKLTFVGTLKMFFSFSFLIKEILKVWYVAFILFLYLIFPFIYKVIKKYDLNGLILSLLVIILFNSLYSFFAFDSYYRNEIALTRIPVFLVGVFLGKQICEKKSISVVLVMISFLLFVLITMILYFNLNIPSFSIFARYLYCPWVLCFVIVFAYLFSLLNKRSYFIFKPWEFLGKYSLEVYLIHYRVSEILTDRYSFSSMFKMYLCSFIITIILSYILKNLIDMIVKVISSLFNRTKCEI